MLQLRHCSIVWTESGAQVAFPDGAHCEAWPHPDQPHYHVIAHRCGYGDDLLAYCREHELAHVLVAQELLRSPSVVLWAQAHGTQPGTGDALREEISAQVVQRWVRANERPIIGSCDWDGIKELFLQCVAQLDRDHCMKGTQS